MVTFIVNPPPFASVIPWIVVVIIAVVAGLVIVFKHGPQRKVAIAIVLAVLVATIAIVFFVVPVSPSTITITPGQITVSGSPFGTKTYASSVVKKAYVAQIGVGNLTISRTAGTSLGDYKEGDFTLNGSSAYVVSTNSTNLIVALAGGSYLILSPPDFSSFISAFSANVSPVNPV